MTMSMNEMEKALKQLRLSGIRATLETRIVESQSSNLTFLETLSLILQDELDRRRSRLLERRYQLSGLEERTGLNDFDWSYNPKIPKRTCFELTTLKFVREGDNAIVIGPPGTGKSHVAKAIAYAAVREGYRVRYAEADALLGQLAQAVGAERKKLLTIALEADLLILDDLFLARKIDADAADQLQLLVHQRYKRRVSTLITSNRIVSDWEKYLGDAALTTTILDRLMHRATLLEFAGRSYRLKEAASRLAKRVQPA
jgi:DNA replication protein DnaC